MKVLFVSGGNSGTQTAIVANQAASLTKKGLQVDTFLIRGRGVRGYLGNIPELRRVVRSGRYDIVHAHYSLSGFAASFSGSRSLVVSLMGSDTYMPGILSVAARFFYMFKWNATIVKSKAMAEYLQLKKAYIIPNGVDIERFITIPKAEAREHINYNGKEKLVIFVADPSRNEKNYPLAEAAVSQLNRADVTLMPVYNVENIMIPYYMNAADALILTSRWEGSVNVVKEAMACCLPVVSTGVGDVSENLRNVTRCFVCPPEPASLAIALDKALQEENRTNGREKLISMGLDSTSVADKLIAVYEQVKDK